MIIIEATASGTPGYTQMYLKDAATDNWPTIYNDETWYDSGTSVTYYYMFEDTYSSVAVSGVGLNVSSVKIARYGNLKTTEYTSNNDLGGWAASVVLNEYDVSYSAGTGIWIAATASGTPEYTLMYLKDAATDGWPTIYYDETWYDSGTQVVYRYTFEMPYTSIAISGAGLIINSVTTFDYLPPVYDVTLNTNGGTIAEGSELTTYEYTVGATLPTAVTKEGYTFAGWYDNEELTGNAVTEIATTSTGSVEYWAKWTPVTVKVTIDDQSATTATVPASFDIAYDAEFTDLTTVAAKTGYTLVGYFTEKNGKGTKVYDVAGEPCVDASAFTSATTLYAYWVAYDYVLSLKSNGGTVDSAYTTVGGNVGDTITLPTAKEITKDNYTFKGWYDNADCTGTAVTTVKIEKAGTGTFYALWEPDTYEVTLNVNEGTLKGDDVTSYTYGTAVTLPTATKKGNAFGGWFAKSDCTGDEVKEISATASGDITLYAKWTPYNKNGKLGTGTSTDYTYTNTLTMSDSSWWTDYVIEIDELLGTIKAEDVDYITFSADHEFQVGYNDAEGTWSQPKITTAVDLKNVLLAPMTDDEGELHEFYMMAGLSVNDGKDYVLTWTVHKKGEPVSTKEIVAESEDGEAAPAVTVDATADVDVDSIVKDAGVSGDDVKVVIGSKVITKDDIADEDLKLMEEALAKIGSDATLSNTSLYSIDLTVQAGTQKVTVTETSKEIAVAIEIQAEEGVELTDKYDYYILRIHTDKDGKKTCDILPATVEEVDGVKYAKVSTDKFSTYALVYVAKATDNSVGDTLPYAIACFVLSGVCAFFVIKRRRVTE